MCNTQKNRKEKKNLAMEKNSIRNLHKKRKGEYTFLRRFCLPDSYVEKVGESSCGVSNSCLSSSNSLSC
jgi:hypothetical protein